MSDFELCENGHYYPHNLNECPYCPKNPNANANQDPYPVNQGSPFGGGDQGSTNLDQTSINSFDADFDPSQFMIGGNDMNQGPKDLSRTQIYGNAGNEGFGGNFPAEFQSTPQSVGRKLVGWLVSFTMDPNGLDFKLYEGRNLIGSDMGCDIVVQNDSAVSGHHLTILHRMGHFKFKDELSTNGTFVNDVFEEEGNLKDGDVIKMGDTIFKFRSIA